MTLAVRGLVGSVVLALAAVAGAAGPRSIFDDDWVPPKSAEGQRPTPVRPATPPASDQAKVEPPGVAPRTVPPATSAARRPVPSKAEQAAVRKVLKEVFAEQLVDRSIPARRKLAEALLAQAGKSGERPAEQFVLLAAAVDAGAEAASLPLAFEAGDLLAKGFDLDGLAVKAETAARLGNRPGAEELAAENVRAGLGVVDQLVEAEAFAAAARVCAALTPVAGANAALRADVQRRQRDVATARDAGERVQRHLEKLKSSPDDPAANLEVGKYFCFVRNDWRAGLAALARGGDAGLKALAARELAGADGAEAQAAIGDGWWDLAQTAAGPNKGALLAHAGDWYARATPGLSGLAKAKVDKRLAQIEPRAAGAGPVDPRLIVKPHAAGAMSVLLFTGNGKGLADFQALSGGKLVAARREQVAPLFANPNALAKYNVIVWEANALCDSQVEMDEGYAQTLRRFVENGGDLVLFEQFRDVNWNAIERPFGIKRIPGGPHEFGEIEPALAAKLKAAKVSDEELPKARFAVAVEMPERGTVLVRNKRGQTIAGVVAIGKGRMIYTGGNGDADHAKFHRVFFEYLFPVK